MKNMSKKTASIMLATSLVCAIMATGCTESNNGNNKSTETTGVYSTKNQEACELELGEEVYTIDDSKSSNYGITADVICKDFLSLETSKASEEEGFDGFADDSVVEIYDIKVKYSTIEYGEKVTKATDDSNVCGDMIVSIPCDTPDLYVLHLSEEGESNDIDAKYVDGRYVFDVDFLGTFMLSTETIDSPEIPREYNMIEQTLVDPKTGVQVSGLIPEGAMLYTKVEDVGYSETLMKEGLPNLPKYDFQLPSLKEIYTKNKSDTKITYDYGNENEVGFFQEGTVLVDVAFVMEHEICEFDSDLTITLPFDYYKVLDNMEFFGLEDFEFDYSVFEEPGAESSGETYYYDGSYYTYEDYVELKELIATDRIAKAFQLNPRTGNLKEIEVLTQKGGAEKFELKTNATGSGTFFVTNKRLITYLVSVYDWSYDDLETFD